MNKYVIETKQLTKTYGEQTVVNSVNIHKALVVQDIAVISSQLCNDTLEDYFKKITGGEGIA